MSSADYILLVFYLTIISLKTSIQLDKLCDRNDTSLVIDSAVAIERESENQIEIKFWLFSGDVFYESNPKKVSDERPKFALKRKVSEIDPNISAPIDMSVSDHRTGRIALGNANVSKIWGLNSDLQYNQSENLYKTLPADDMIYWRNNLTLIYSNEPSLKMMSQRIPKTLFLQYSDDKKSVKVTENDGQYRHFESQLNGHRISAATDVTLNNKTFVYLFAGRMLCRQELSEQFVEVCDIKDIADWIDCTEDTSDTSDKPADDSKTLLIVLVVVGIFVVLLIIVIIVSVWLIFSNGRPKSGTDPKATSKSSVNAVRSDLKSTDVKV